MKKLLIVALATLLAACSQGLSGTWNDGMGMVSYTFDSDGKVTVETLGKAQQSRYTRDGNTLKVAVPGSEAQSVEFTINEDGSLQGPMGVRLHKQKK
ncbi:DUF5640 domain-containing protein [uncultured Stenotrophomonas sp.]|uniref:DUF5640 domain-containing protein n=1 Tax=uncultured Stenotrophomonas sp. TaxID=165438 RepID=UPI0025D66C89|nr:DUF5640 domain-containing protein [uncultured Stenotrophomonas sp.]